MRILILCFAFVFMPWLHAYSNISHEVPLELEKKTKRKIKKKIAKKNTDGLSLSASVSIIGAVFIIVGLPIAIVGAVFSSPVLLILGTLFTLFGLFCFLVILLAIILKTADDEPRNKTR